MTVLFVNTVKIDDVETKKKLVGELTDSVEKYCKVPREIIRIILREDPPENIGIGGRLPLLEGRR